MDDSSPSNLSEISHGLWHGDGRNRFFDKSMQIIVFNNKKSGIMTEHSMFDGTVMLTFMNFCYH